MKYRENRTSKDTLLPPGTSLTCYIGADSDVLYSDYVTCPLFANKFCQKTYNSTTGIYARFSSTKTYNFLLHEIFENHTCVISFCQVLSSFCTWFWYRMHYKWYFDFDHLPLWHKSVQWFGNHRDQTNGCHHYCCFSNLLRKNVLDLVEENSSIFC